MKRLLLTICTALYCLSGVTQSGCDININTVPETGILMDKCWRYQQGDNMQWAQPDYDDRTWKPINPAKNLNELPELQKNIVWLRLHFTVDSSLIGRLCMVIQQSAASEMYLNGNLIQRFGVVSTNPAKVVAYNPLWQAVSLPANSSIEQVLAVRYVLQPHVHYSYFLGTENKGLEITVNKVENASTEYRQRIQSETERYIFMVGLFLILAILYLAFYLFYPAQKVNLFFSLYALLQSANFFLVAEFRYINRIDLWFPFHLAVNINQVVDYLILLYAIYRLLEHKRGVIYYFLVAFAIICIPLNFLQNPRGWMIYGFVFTTLFNFDITRVSLKAAISRKKGAWFIAAGCIAYFVFWFVMTGIFFQIYHGSYSEIIYSVLFELSFLAIPVAVSIYLGYDFALTHRSLQQKLTEVERLSHEKQEILAAQNVVLEKQVAKRTAELKRSLEELKYTQAQLIQSEKMASLGELTAGIAHEIQNPLNFVNNFSEVNKELIEELEEEANSGNIHEVKAITKDLKENEEKINYHGKRADAIVKGMLQHSRVSTGQKEPTDINALVNEYLGLSYHGFKAKDKSFDATIEAHFDENTGKIEVVPQDIGRVLLNLFNNAFYAVTEKRKQLDETFQPVVSVSTERIGNKVQVHVKDNGTGIPQKVVDKIFQPFFTTKPTGQGTGLGLSLSYDIIKAHGGELKAESKEGEGAEFIIQLPGK